MEIVLVMAVVERIKRWRMSEISMNLQEQIAFCEEKSKNIKLKTEPQTFVNIKANLEKLEKIEQFIKEYDGAIIISDNMGIVSGQRLIDELKQIVKG